jgi:hypothetical protein
MKVVLKLIEIKSNLEELIGLYKLLSAHKDQWDNMEAAVLPEIMDDTAADLPFNPKVGADIPLSTLSSLFNGEVIESSLTFDGDVPSISAFFPFNYFLFFGAIAKTQIVETLNSTATTAHRIM